MRRGANHHHHSFDPTSSQEASCSRYKGRIDSPSQIAFDRESKYICVEKPGIKQPPHVAGYCRSVLQHSPLEAQSKRHITAGSSYNTGRNTANPAQIVTQQNEVSNKFVQANQFDPCVHIMQGPRPFAYLHTNTNWLLYSSSLISHHQVTDSSPSYKLLLLMVMSPLKTSMPPCRIALSCPSLLNTLVSLTAKNANKV